MAHIEKYKAASCGHMLAHYRRDASSLGRENIDPERTKDNYTLGLDGRDGKVRAMKGIEPNWATVEGRIERVNEAAKAAGKRATRKDAVVMADVVVTLPENVRKGDEGKFFGYTYWFLIKKLGKENMMGGFVHRDEVRKDGSPVRDHMHVPFTPIFEGRFNYKQMCPRSFYQGLHKELGDYLERLMGYRPEIELDEETRAQRVYTDKAADIDKVRGAVDKAVVQPARDTAAALLDEAEQKAAERLSETQARVEVLEGLADDEEERLECLRRARGAAQGRVAELAEQVEGARARAAELESVNRGLRARLAELRECLRAAVSRFKALGDRTHEEPPKAAQPPTAASVMAGAMAATKRYNETHAPAQRRGWSRGR